MREFYLAYRDNPKVQPLVAQIGWTQNLIILQRCKDRHAAEGRSFAFETTLSGLTYARMIPRWRTAGFAVKLIFLSLTTPDKAIERVAMRVRQGGHDIPPEIIRRRFAVGLRNFQNVYRHYVDYWHWFDNSNDTPILNDEGVNA